MAFSLQIADIEFKTQIGSGFAAVENHPLYQEFILPDAKSTTPMQVPVDISIADPRPSDSWPVVFDSNETWLAFADRDDLVLAFRSPVEPDTWWWSARLDADHRNVQIICDPEILERGDHHTKIVNPLRYPLDQLLTMFVLASRGGCIVHSAGLAVDNRGVAFVGKSGAGKTTLMNVIEDRPGSTRLSDDRVILRLEDDGARIYGTPWAGEGMVAANAKADLAAIVFLHHSPENHLEPIAAREAAEQLLPTTSIPWFHTGAMTGCLDTLDRIVENTPCFNLHFRPDRDITEIISPLF